MKICLHFDELRNQAKSRETLFLLWSSEVSLILLEKILQHVLMEILEVFGGYVLQHIFLGI